MSTPVGRPTDDALWASVVATLRDVVLPAVQDEHARAAVVQLAGLAEYGRTRGDNPTAARGAALRDAVFSLAGNELVRPPLGPQESDVLRACSDALVAAVGRTDEAANDVRRVLRPLLVQQLDDDLAGNAVLLAAFRGRLPDAG